MPYAIRYNSATDLGTLVERTRGFLAKAEAAQREASERFEAYFDTPECARPVTRPAEHPYPHFEAVSAEKAHGWVRCGYTHETALYVDSDKRVRRAHDGEY